ncbi:MAG TPA: hypothetical protein VEC96_02475 [Anaerolineae bacterium]|nr:hypothetical protein [Anaerolineae bacterium]
MINDLSWPIFRLWGLVLWATRRRIADWGYCPWCNYDGFDWMKRPWFEPTGGGISYVPGEPTVHWGEGIQTCPRCRYKWFVQGSD